MNKLTKDLKTVARQLNTLSKKTESLAKAFEKTPATPARKKTIGMPKTRTAPQGGKTTPTDQVLNIMKRYKNGITVDALREKSGFNEKQISNIVHRACKKDKMKRIGRGVYSVFGF
jgi:hypothetical protein